jgi:putative endonuclease
LPDLPAAAAWYCYILECRDGTLYTGLTNDPDRRWREHLSGRAARYTRQRPPQRIAYLEPQPDRATAMRRERALKNLSRRAKLKLIGLHTDDDAPFHGEGGEEAG